MSKITFTKEEYMHIANSFDRIRQSLSRLKPEDWDKGNRPIIKQLNTKFTDKASDFPEYEVILNRNHLRMLQEYCNATVKRVNEHIIPAYEKRGDKTDYIEQSKELVKKIEGIISKVEACL